MIELKEGIKIGIVGSRRRNSLEDREQVEAALKPFLHLKPVLVSGGCKLGGDSWVNYFVDKYNLPDPVIHYPDKSKLPPDPQLEDFRRINFARNELIARDSELIIACVAKDRLGGTENTLKHFLKTYNKPKENLILVEDLSDVNEFFL